MSQIPAPLLTLLNGLRITGRGLLRPRAADCYTSVGFVLGLPPFAPLARLEAAFLGDLLQPRAAAGTNETTVRTFPQPGVTRTMPRFSSACCTSPHWRKKTSATECRNSSMACAISSCKRNSAASTASQQVQRSSNGIEAPQKEQGNVGIVVAENLAGILHLRRWSPPVFVKTTIKPSVRFVKRKSEIILKATRDL